MDDMDAGASHTAKKFVDFCEELRCVLLDCPHNCGLDVCAELLAMLGQKVRLPVFRTHKCDVRLLCLDMIDRMCVAMTCMDGFWSGDVLCALFDQLCVCPCCDFMAHAVRPFVYGLFARLDLYWGNTTQVRLPHISFPDLLRFVWESGSEPFSAENPHCFPKATRKGLTLFDASWNDLLICPCPCFCDFVALPDTQPQASLHMACSSTEMVCMACFACDFVQRGMQLECCHVSVFMLHFWTHHLHLDWFAWNFGTMALGDVYMLGGDLSCDQGVLVSLTARIHE
eukprot:2130953-Amphidinium_carterae.1